MQASSHLVSLAETYANRTLHLVQLVMDRVRGTTDITRWTNNSLWSIMDEDLKRQVQEIYAKVQEGIPENDRYEAVPSSTTCVNEEQPTSSSVPDERFQLVFDILLPLIDSLTRCYFILDQVPTPPRGRGKPAPPVGMLSIQNYTDVAALLELLVCLSILPNLEPNILLTAKQRAAVLPKSIAGRLPRTCLLWIDEHSSSLVCTSSSSWKELEWTAISIGNCLLLDRFRPMLLPRHLTDLYAAMFQAEHLANHQLLKEHSQQHRLDNLKAALLPNDKQEQNVLMIDSVLQVRALQSLLSSQGKAAPVWLKRRVSSLLSDVASRDLAAVVKVFCDESSSSSSTASLRLARAVMTQQDDAYCDTICSQMVLLLDGMVQGNDSAKTMTTLSSAQATSNVNTIWALMDYVPTDLLQQHFLGPLREFFDDETSWTTPSSAIPRVVHRFGVLLSVVPPFANMEKLCEIILQPFITSNRGMILFTLLVRIATMPSVLHSSTKADAQWTLVLLAKAMAGSKPKLAGSCVLDGSDLFAVALVYALGPTAFDLNGYCLVETKDDFATLVCMKKDAAQTPTSTETIANGIEQRTKSLIKDVFGVMLEETEDQGEKNDSSFLAAMFLVLLQILFGDESSKTREATALFYQDGWEILPLVALPVLCEECSLDSLLQFHDASTTLFTVMQLIYHKAIEKFQLDDTTNQTKREASSHLSTFENRLTRLNTSMQACGSVVELDSGSCSSSASMMHVDDELLLSLCSVLLSLLVGILELGSKRRSDTEERMIGSLSPELQVLASPDGSGRTEFVSSEIMEMASHAVALIATRNGSELMHNSAESDVKESLPSRLDRVEQDLKSEQPPIRARGVVELRHIVSATHEEKASNGSVSAEELAWRLLRLAVASTGDDESYVYLAAIHTIPIIVELALSPMVLSLASAVSNGVFRVADEVEIQLCLNQRVKLAEALIAIVKRRSAMNEYLPLLTETLIFGGETDRKGSTGRQEDFGELIQKQTHEHFLVVEDEQESMLSTKAERLEAQNIRFAAGGPLFTTEEVDVVRASRLTILSEVVTVSEPALVARFCPALVHAALVSVRLDASRPVRRAGALLGRALYAALVREQESINASGDAQATFAVSMARAKEDALAAALERCARANDLDDIKGNQRRFLDPSTIARCEEALEFRKEAEEGGILAAGHLLLEADTNEKLHPISRTLSEPSAKGAARFGRPLMQEI